MIIDNGVEGLHSMPPPARIPPVRREPALTLFVSTKKARPPLRPARSGADAPPGPAGRHRGFSSRSCLRPRVLARRPCSRPGLRPTVAPAPGSGTSTPPLSLARLRAQGKAVFFANLSCSDFYGPGISERAHCTLRDAA